MLTKSVVIMIPLTDLSPGKRMALLIQDVSRLIRHRMDLMSQDSGLTSAQWRVLASVARCRSLNLEPLNQATLADMLDVEPITLSRQIDRLASAGLIERRPDPNDRRAHRLHLTAKADPMVAEFREIAARMMKGALDGIDDSEVEFVVSVLERLRTNLTGKDTAIAPDAEPVSLKESA